LFTFALKYEETFSSIQYLKRCKLDVDKKKQKNFVDIDTKTTKNS